MEPPIKPLITDPELAENFSDEFTCQTLPSPVMSKKGGFGDDDFSMQTDKDPFGGFSFVASQRLLDEGLWD
ncbi:hypothetical protein EFM1_31550 [Enterococcus faecium]|nr:hypothetical protein EFM1_31550 [Enterococcus faecium]